MAKKIQSNLEVNGTITASPSENVNNLVTKQELNDLDLNLLKTSSTIVTSRNILITDFNGLNNSTAATDVTITIVDDTTIPAEIGTPLVFKRSGTGNVIVTGGIGTTVPTHQTYSLDDTIVYRKITANTWECLNPPINVNAIIANTANLTSLSENINSIKGILENNLRDCSIFVCSDSTGNGDNEWVYRFTNEYLAVTYPAFSVEYHLYDSGTQTYSDVTLQTGTGSNTLHIYNGAISGAQPADFIGENKQTSIIDNAPYDLLIVNHGHNAVGSYTQTDDIKETRGLFLEFTEEFLKINPDVGVLIFNQSPWRDDDSMKNNFESVNSLCGLRGFGMVDVYSQYIKQNKDASLYIDNIHPSTLGTDLHIQEIKKAWDSNTSGTKTHQSLFNEYSSVNLLKNGSFEDYDTGVPEGWISSGATVTKETTIVDPSSYNNYSLKIENGLLFFPIDDNLIQKLNGKVVTYAVRIFVPDAQSVGTGRIGLTSTGFSVLSPNQFNGNGGWRWKIITTTLNLDTIFYARIYGTTDTVGTCYIDRAILVEGELPKDFIQKVNGETITLKNPKTSIAQDEELGGVSVWSNDQSTNSSGEAGSMKVVCENAFGSIYGIKFYSKNNANFNELAHMANDGTFKTNGYKLNALQTAPTSASDTGTLGEIRYDENYMYLCTATDTWKRSALTIW